MIKKELLEKFKNMPQDELQSYIEMTGIFQTACTVLGVSAILLFLYFSGLITALITTCALYFLGRLSISADSIRKHVFEILALQNKDK